MKINLKLTVILLGIYFPAEGQAGYEVKGTLENSKPGVCYLGHYFGSAKSVIYKDTAKINIKGEFTFEGKFPLEQGLYFVEFQNKKRVELVVDRSQSIQFKTDFLKPAEKFKIESNIESSRYQNYINFVRPRQKRISTKISPTEFQKINEELSSYQQKFFSGNQTSLSYRLLAASEVPFTPNFTLPNGKIDSVKRFYYYKNHLFDNINLSDERLLKSPFIEPRLTEYLEKLTVKSVDSVTASFDFLMRRTASPAFRKYFTTYASNYLQKNPFIGADNAWIYIIDKYYLAEPSLWNADAYAQTKQRTNILRPLILGKTFPNIVLKDSKKSSRDLSTINSKYTIVYFYSLDCPHCQEHAPKLAAFQRKMKNVKVYAVAVENEEQKWKNFITKYHTENLINVIDRDNKLDFKNDFDVLEYPTNYILDAEKKIVGKKINPALFEAYINYLEKK